MLCCRARLSQKITRGYFVILVENKWKLFFFNKYPVKYVVGKCIDIEIAKSSRFKRRIDEYYIIIF